MSQSSREQFAEVMRRQPVDLGLACLLVGAEVAPDLDLAAGLGRLDELAAVARPFLPHGCGPLEAAEGLRACLGGREGFAGAPGDYEDLRSSLLHEVLVRRRGLPLLLSVVWAEVARRLQTPAYPIAAPGHVVVGFGDPGGLQVHADPFAGGRIIERPAGPAPLTVWPADPVELMARLLANITALSLRRPPSQDATRTRLWAVELTLLLPRHALDLRRDRGNLLVRTGRHTEGASELEKYAAAVADEHPDVAEECLRDARAARARLN
ncbi:MAG: transglutaminase-like domain-containing protein [Actinomycetota bacterium]|nr:transglutaminase-like domain-containing protein [Actinomycetota bacterium]